ncbi:hypothetical protein [Xanthomonas hortorum]|uniref:hypothetical protein n=1 Tax=Xanthomonas hortorum TaxID=56454 RepID=UPI0015943A34|nr:hypothetical protein [Xanthomonas hortorum]NHF67283.1 hypothetical protein [Xanthomonas hortorum]
MSKVEKMPKLGNIPDLHGNVEGLKRHSFACVFIPDPNLSQDDRKLRSWLLNTVASASRHYLKARELVRRQEDSDQSKDGGAVFHILDVSEEIEDCVMATYRACMAIRRMNSFQSANDFSRSCEGEMESLRQIRNQFDHMHAQIIASETGNGPISIVFGDEGKVIRFRRLSMDTASLGGLIDGAYEVVASLYPAFNANSRKESGGPIMMTITASVEVTEADGTKRIIK